MNELLGRIMRIHSKFIVILLVFGTISCGTRPTPNLEGKPISSLVISYQGTKTVEEANLTKYITSKPGTNYSSYRIDSDIRSLYLSGLVDDVIFQAKPTNEQVSLSAKVSTRPPLGPGGRFIGNSSFSDKKLAKVTKLKAGQSVTKARIEAARCRLEEFYYQSGYKDVSITIRYRSDRIPKIEEVFFTVVEGTKSAS